MKKLLFDAVAIGSFATIFLIDKGVQALVWLVAFLGGVSRTAVAKLGIYLMKKVDEERFEEQLAEEEAQLELEQQATELELLSNATKLKEHALESGDWTDQHTEALNAIGNALLNDCDWDEDSVHQYLKDVVESGTGLSYGRESDEDDD